MALLIALVVGGVGVAIAWQRGRTGPPPPPGSLPGEPPPPGPPPNDPAAPVRPADDDGDFASLLADRSPAYAPVVDDTPTELSGPAPAEPGEPPDRPGPPSG